jgi:hypothetical protein
MTLISICPVCRAPGIRYSHRVAAAMDTLMPAQCLTCGKYSIAVPFSTSWLGVPEAVAGPVGLIVWLATQDLRFAVQLGLLAYAGVFSVVAKRARLVAFVPENDSKLKNRRARMLWTSLGGFALLFLLTAAIP